MIIRMTHVTSQHLRARVPRITNFTATLARNYNREDEIREVSKVDSAATDLICKYVKTALTNANEIMIVLCPYSYTDM